MLKKFAAMVVLQNGDNYDKDDNADDYDYDNNNVCDDFDFDRQNCTYLSMVETFCLHSLFLFSLLLLHTSLWVQNHYHYLPLPHYYQNHLNSQTGYPSLFCNYDLVLVLELICF